MKDLSNADVQSISGAMDDPIGFALFYMGAMGAVAVGAIVLQVTVEAATGINICDYIPKGNGNDDGCYYGPGSLPW